MTRAALILILALGVAACATLDYRRTYHDGPPSDHFDGRRFFNPEGPISKGLVDLLRWWMSAETAEWPEQVPLQQRGRPPQRVQGDELLVTFIGHASVLIQTAGLNILTDPIWSERASPVSWMGPRRVTPPGVAFEDLPPIDLVLVSHNHYDHLDLPTLARLDARDAPLMVMPLGNEAIIAEEVRRGRIATLDWWEGAAVGAQLHVHLVPVYHWSRRRLFDRNKALWGGFVIATPQGQIYIAGDTGLGSGRFFQETAERFRPFRLALLPVGAYEPRWFMKAQHVNPAEAVQIHRILGAHTSVGVHLRTFQLTDEGIGQPELELEEARRAHNVSAERFLTLPIGGSWRAPVPQGE